MEAEFRDFNGFGPVARERPHDPTANDGPMMAHDGRMRPRASFTGFQTGLGQTCFFTEGPQIPYILPYYFVHVRIFCHTYHICCYMLPHFSMKVDHGESRRFCGDPVRPSPVREAVRSLSQNLQPDYETNMKRQNVSITSSMKLNQQPY